MKQIKWEIFHFCTTKECQHIIEQKFYILPNINNIENYFKNVFLERKKNLFKKKNEFYCFFFFETKMEPLPKIIKLLRNEV